MSEQPAQPVTRIDVPVTSDTTGFGALLRKKLEQETRGVEATVGVGINKTLKARDQLRRDIKSRVVEAAAGLAATVEVQADATVLRSSLEKAAKEAARGITATVAVDADASKLKAKIAAAAKKAGTTVNLTMEVEGDAAAEAAAQAKAAKEAAEKTPVNVIVQARDKLTEGVTAAVAKAKAFVKATKTKIDVPVEAGQGFAGAGGMTGAGGLLGVLGARSKIGRATKMLTALVAILSLVGPAVAVVVGSLGSLTAAAGAVGQAVGVIAGAPGILLALVSALGAGIIAFSGFTGELDKMPPAMREAARTVRSFAGDWEELVRLVQISFWGRFDQELRESIAVTLPMLSKGLNGVSTELGLFVEGFLKFVQSPQFANDFPSGMESAARLTGGFGDALQGVIEWFFAATEAAEPFLDRVSKGATAFGEWTAGLLDTRQERNEFAAFLLRATDRLSQLGSIVESVWTGLRGVFAGGMESGDRILTDWDESLEKWSAWVNSPEGGEAIKAWFDAVEPTARAVGEFFQEVGSALLDLAIDKDAAKLIDQITYEALPELVDLVKALGESLGPEVISFITGVIDLVNALSSSGDAIGGALGYVNDFLDTLNELLDDHPDAADAIGKIVGSLLLLKAVSPILKRTGGLLAGIGAALGSIKRAGGLGTLGKIAGAGAGAAGAGGLFGNLFGKKPLQVFWSTAMPVWTTTPPSVAPGGGAGKHGNGKTQTGGKPAPGRHARTAPAGALPRGAAGKIGLATGAALLLGSLFGGGGTEMVDPVTGEPMDAALSGLGGGGGALALAGGAGLAGWGAYDVFKKRRGGGGRTAGRGAGGALRGLGGKALRAGGPLGLIASIGGSLLGGAIQDGTGRNNARNAFGGVLGGAAGGAGLGAMIGSVIPGVGTAIGAGVGGVVGGAKGYVDATGGMDAVLERVRGWDKEVSGKITGVAKNVGTKTREIAGDIDRNFLKAVDTTKQKFGQIRDRAGEGITGAKDTVVRRARELGDGLSTKWDEVRTGTSRKWTEISGAVTGKATELKDGVVRRAEETRTGAAEKWTAFKDDAGAKFESARRTVVEKATGLRDGAADRFESVRRGAAEKWTSFKDDAGAKFETARRTVTEKATSIRDTTADRFESVRRTAADKWTSFKDDAGTKFETARKTVTDKATAIRDTAGNRFESVRRTASEKWTAFKDDTSSKFETARQTVSTKAESIRTTAATKVEQTRANWSRKLGELRDNTGSRLEEARVRAGERVESLRSGLATKAEQVRAGWNTKMAQVRDNTTDRLQETKRWAGVKLDEIKGAFQVGRDALGKAWSFVSDKIKAPVRTLVDPVYSTIRSAFNAIGGLVGKSIKAVPLNFATGGVLPGYTPGRDVHAFASPTAGRLNLSGGEAIMRPEWTRGVGAGFVNAMNAIAASKGVRGVRDAMSSVLDDRLPQGGAADDKYRRPDKGTANRTTVTAFQRALARHGSLRVLDNAPRHNVGAAARQWDGIAGLSVRTGRGAMQSVADAVSQSVLGRKGIAGRAWFGTGRMHLLGSDSRSAAQRQRTAMHEIGHVLGLLHPSTGRASAMKQSKSGGAMAPTMYDVDSLEGLYQPMKKITATAKAGAVRATQAVRSGLGGFVKPITGGTISSPFGPRGSGYHRGLDWAVRTGTAVRAAADGLVKSAGYQSSWGNHIFLNHAGGMMTNYAHLSRMVAKAGQAVKQGQLIGYSGNTGNSTGPHLHWETWLNGVRKNPMQYLTGGNQGSGGGGVSLASFLPALDSARKLIGDKLKGSVWANEWLGGGARSLFDSAKQKAMTWVTDLIPDGVAGAVGKVGSGVERWRGTVEQALGILGQPKSLVETVLRRMNQESGGRPGVVNNWDSNARKGQNSRGLMQVIPSTFAGFAMPGYNKNIMDPLSNILAGMRWSMHRWGSIAAGFNRKGGYFKGGIIPELAKGATVRPTPGGTLARIAEAGRAETIVDEGLVNARLADLEGVRDLLERAARFGGAQVHVHPQPRQSEQEIGRVAADQLQWQRTW